MFFPAFLRCRLALGVFLAVVSWPLLGQEPASKKPGSLAKVQLSQEKQKLLKERDSLIPEIQKLRAWGKLDQAARLIEKMLALEKAIFGEIHDEVAGSLDWLGIVWAERGDFQKARVARAEALKIYTQLHGETYWRAINSRWGLAEVDFLATLSQETRGQLKFAKKLNRESISRCAGGKYAAAEKVLRQALQIRQKILGEEHPDTAMSYNNLAYALSRQAKTQESDRLNWKALAIRRKVLGEEHPDTALSYNNLAYDLRQQGQYPEAEGLDRKALAIRCKVLGEEHPDTAISYGTLASDLCEQAKYPEAEALDRKALAIRRKVLGEEHPLGQASRVLFFEPLVVGGQVTLVVVEQAALPGPAIAGPELLNAIVVPDDHVPLELLRADDPHAEFHGFLLFRYSR